MINFHAKTISCDACGKTHNLVKNEGKGYHVPYFKFVFENPNSRNEKHVCLECAQQ